MTTSFKSQIISAQKALSLTGITIADYVINPYRGCTFGCFYCYAKRNKGVLKRDEKWGQFVDIKKNLPELLEKELQTINPKRVLLGSITECYQEAEKEFGLTRKVLEILKNKKIPITILTKSDLILRDADILSQQKENQVCFTISPLDDLALRCFETRSPFNNKRIEAIKGLKDFGVDVYAHVGPLMPGLFDIQKVVSQLRPLGVRIDFEIFNYLTMDGGLVKSIYEHNFPCKYKEFCDMYSSQSYYEKYWEEVCNSIEKECVGIKFKIHVHPLDDYFINRQGQY